VETEAVDWGRLEAEAVDLGRAVDWGDLEAEAVD